MTIAIILGTRPEIIKLSPIIREIQRLNLDFFIIHTGQHYSYNMDEIFFEQLKLPCPDYQLRTGSGSHATQTGKMIIEIEEVLMKKKPKIVVVEGDTNTVLAGSLVAAKLNILIGHVEAGLRSYYRQMPEEINRIVADHCADFLFAPTVNAKKNLLCEGIHKNKIFITGNTIVDAVHHNLKMSKDNEVLDHLGLIKKRYFLVTLHRQENVDNEKRYHNILRGLKLIQEDYRLDIIFPIHPRSKKQMKKFNLNHDGITLIEPLDYLSFLQLQKNARLLLTDSGGIQEEACIMNIPCVTLRDNTERPETLEINANVLAGTQPKDIFLKVNQMMTRNSTWKHPYGKGDTGKRIVHIIMKKLAFCN